MTARDPLKIEFEITNLSGEKRTYILTPLKRKQAAFVAHNFLRAILKGFSSAARGSESAALEALSNIDFEILWELAKVLLKYSTIKCGDHIVTIDDLEECDHFEENPEELYMAVFHGVKGNYPKVFSKVRNLTKGIFPQVPGEAETTSPLGTSNTVSVTSK